MDLGNIRAGLDVAGSDGGHLGTVDRVERSRIEPRRDDPAPGGRHHWLEQSTIASADGGTARFAVPAGRARQARQGEAPSPRGI